MMQQVATFLSLLTGEQDPVVTWQTFYDVKDGTNRPDLAKVFSCNLNGSMEYLNYAQSQKCGVYVCINETDMQGREAHNITKLRVMFADYDGIAEPIWPVPPSFKTNRDATHGHAYWVINPDEWKSDEWTIMQKRISLICGTDPQVIDPTRVARVPTFLHLKDPANPRSYNLVQGGARLVHTKANLLAGFSLDEKGETDLQSWFDKRNGFDNGEGYTDNPVYIARSIAWLSERALPAIDGCEGTSTLYKSVAFLHDLGISIKACRELAWEHYNPRCEPPWGDAERSHFDDVIGRAYKYSRSEPGCKTATAEFSRLGAVPEPVDGWENNAAINNHPVIEITSNPVDDRITRVEAIMLQPQLTPKSSHYELARTFDGAMFNGEELKRCDRVFYQYNGKCWLIVSDEVIKSSVQKYYAHYKPADSFTKGVYACLCDLINVPEFINKTWMGEEITNPKATVVFQNNIVDFSGDTPKKYAHTPSFITFNALPINYDPNATCPRFTQFLSEIWGTDEDMKKMLTEWMGYLLIAGNDFQKMAVLMGVSRGGKSLIAKLCCELVGLENIASTDLNDIHKDSTIQDMHLSSLTYMPDQQDVDFQNKNRSLGTLKAVTGGDPIGWHLIFKGRRKGVISSKLMMTTNNLPTFSDASGALVNRMLAFPFDVSFEGREDFSLEKKLIAELPGITNLALEGLKRLRANGRFTEPRRSVEEKVEVKNSMFSLSEFIDDYCVLDTHALRTPVDDIYHAYKIWATSAGIRNTFDKRKMLAELRNSPHGLTRHRPRIDGELVQVLRGIRISKALKFDNVTAINGNN